MTAGEEDSAQPSGLEEKKDPGAQVCRHLQEPEKAGERSLPRSLRQEPALLSVASASRRRPLSRTSDLQDREGIAVCCLQSRSQR